MPTAQFDGGGGIIANQYPIHPANTWRADPRPGERWDETQNRLITDRLTGSYTRPGMERATTAPATSRATQGQASAQVDKPSMPISFVLAPHTRQMMLERKYTREGNAEPSAANKALWARLDLHTCLRGITIDKVLPGYTPCTRISVETGAYCDRHSCIAIGLDGYRCPNVVDDPTITRICASGFHIENDRDHFIQEAYEHRRQMEVVEAAQKVIEDEELARIVSHLDFGLTKSRRSSPEAKATLLPWNTSDTSINASSGATSQQITPKTPPMPLISEIDNWWTQHADPDRLEIVRKARGLGLKVSVEPVLSPPMVEHVHAVFAKPAAVDAISTASREYKPRQPPVRNDSNMATRASSLIEGKLYLGTGSKMAKLMTERFGNGFVRKQAFGRAQSQSGLDV